MKLPNGNIILTPQEDAPDHAPDWRYQIALAYAQNPLWMLPEPWASDAAIRATREYLLVRDMIQDGTYLLAVETDPVLAVFQRIFKWHDDNSRSDTRARLEALLLTPASYDVITQDIFAAHVPVDYVETYEKLFFNVRDDAGQLTTSVAMCSKYVPDIAACGTKTDSPTLWKLIAMRGGYTALISYWSSLHGIGELDRKVLMREAIISVIQAKLLHRAATGQISAYDQNTLLSTLQTGINQERALKDEGNDPEVSESNKILATALFMMRPELLIAAVNDPEKQRALNSTKETTREIMAQAVMDKGPAAGYEVLMRASESKLTEHKRVVKASKEKQV